MKPANIDLAEAVVAVTGGARGIGAATAELFAARGSRVCIGDLDGAEAAATAEGLGSRVHPFALDVRSEESFARFVGSAEDSVGPIDVLVNNAGVMPAGSFLLEKAATTSTVLAVNVVGPVNGMRVVLPRMLKRRRGHVVNVASMLGKTELPGLATYVASKHALVGLSAAIRSELAGTGVTLTTVLPSVVDTDLSSGISLPNWFARLARVGPEDVASAILDSCERRPSEVAVPRWVALYPMLRPLIPERVEQLVRRVIGDDRALHGVDSEDRAPYAERIAKQVLDEI